MKLKILYKGPEKGRVVKADKIRVQQILFNLISNAIKFSPQSSTITVLVSESKV
jgi:signal transduction histidine kinase